jgi:diadenosine tetraphosphate (Ap4A) HIT family hydrolase
MSVLSQAEFATLMGDVHVVVRALTEEFRPDKVNVMIIGDASTHMHIHVCPKYRDGKDWGKPFCLNEPEPVLKPAVEMDAIIERIRERIELCQKC